MFKAVENMIRGYCWKLLSILDSGFSEISWGFFGIKKSKKSAFPP
jgi:hypothetical protein